MAKKVAWFWGGWWYITILDSPGYLTILLVTFSGWWKRETFDGCWWPPTIGGINKVKLKKMWPYRWAIVAITPLSGIIILLITTGCPPRIKKNTVFNVRGNWNPIFFLYFRSSVNRIEVKILCGFSCQTSMVQNLFHPALTSRLQSVSLRELHWTWAACSSSNVNVWYTYTYILPSFVGK